MRVSINTLTTLLSFSSPPTNQRLPTSHTNRRQLLLAAAGAAFANTPLPGSAAEMTPGDAKRAAYQQQTQDPYAGSRGNGRLGFADEVAPLDAAEKNRRAQVAAEAAKNTRLAPQVSKSAGPAAGRMARVSDEFTIQFEPGSKIGLKLKDLRVGFEYGTTEGTSRVLVADVAPGGQAAADGRVEIDNIIVAVDGQNVERSSAREVQQLLAQAAAAGDGVKVTFKNALAFNEQLSVNPNRVADPKAQISTEIAPATSTSKAQVLGVRRISIPDKCTRNADNGDLLEIRYAGRLEDGTVFDGMKLADRFGDDSIQFVLGRQPAGQFPPSWDVGLLGMCVNERREIDVPPALGFGPKGLVKKGKQIVPPDARIFYDVELIAINALSTE